MMKLHLVALCEYNRVISRDGHDKDCCGSCVSRSKRKRPCERREPVDIGAAQTTRRRGAAVGRGYQVRTVDLLTEMLKGFSQERGAAA